PRRPCRCRAKGRGHGPCGGPACPSRGSGVSSWGSAPWEKEEGRGGRTSPGPWVGDQIWQSVHGGLGGREREAAKAGDREAVVGGRLPAGDGRQAARGADLDLAQVVGQQQGLVDEQVAGGHPPHRGRGHGPVLLCRRSWATAVASTSTAKARP